MDFKTHRVISTVAAISLFGPAFAAWSSIIQIPVIGAVTVVAFAAIIVAILTAFVVKSEGSLRKLDFVILGMAVILLLVWAASQLYRYPSYGTDEAAYMQYAAQLLLNGHNPYTSNLLPALAKFRVPIQYATYTLNGRISSALAYPSLSFLLVVPFIVLTHGTQSVIICNVFFLAVEMIVVFFLLPHSIRSLAPLLVIGLPILFGYSVAGVNDALFMPFLSIVAYRWSDIGRSGQLGKGGIIRAICLGLAVSISQLPWFIMPFLILGVWLLRKRELGNVSAIVLTARFFGIVCITALTVNAPFIVWNAKAWLAGITTPLFQHAIPYGQGLIDATAYFNLGGGNLTFYTFAAIAVMLAMLLAYAVYFDRYWKVAFVLPALALLFPTRSLAEYFMTVIVVWVISFVCAGNGPLISDMPSLQQKHNPLLSSTIYRLIPTHLTKLLNIITVIAFLPAVILLYLAMTSAPPLSLSIKSVETNGQFQKIWQIQVLVINKSDSAIKPHFATNFVGQMTAFWEVSHGPLEIMPRSKDLYTLVAPNVGSMPGVTQPFVLQAVTAQPQSISSSQLYTPERFSSYISPSYFNLSVPYGKSINLSVQLRSPYGGRVYQGGIRIALGQIIYAQTALIPAEAQINNAPQGQTPVIATTNANGVAQFRVRAFNSQGGNPIYFQAYIYPSDNFPYGYSEVVSVNWK